MNPITHLLVSWGVANTLPRSTRRERFLISVGGIIPDLDGIGAVPDVITRTLDPAHATRYFHEYHHLLGHNVGFAALCGAAAFALAGRGASAGRRAVVAGLALLTFHLHLVCDVIGAKGPDGSQWPIPYLLPFSDVWQWRVPWQWELNAWPNQLLTGLLLVLTGFLTVRRGYSIVEVVSLRADAAVVTTLRRRFAPRRLEEPTGEGSALQSSES